MPLIASVALVQCVRNPAGFQSGSILRILLAALDLSSGWPGCEKFEDTTPNVPSLTCGKNTVAVAPSRSRLGNALKRRCIFPSRAQASVRRHFFTPCDAADPVSRHRLATGRFDICAPSYLLFDLGVRPGSGTCGFRRAGSRDGRDLSSGCHGSTRFPHLLCNVPLL
jgi:hypothetical protein